MATFAASGIPYRTFAATLTAPVQAEHEINNAGPTEPLAQASRANAFPLLMAALPEVTQFPMPHPFVALDIAPAARTTPSPRAKEPSPNTGTTPPAPKQNDTLSEAQPLAVFRLPASKKAVTHKLNRHTSVPNGGGDRTTPLAAVFRTLQVESPARQDRSVPHSQLQNILRRL
jgi:hypothetical protein